MQERTSSIQSADRLPRQLWADRFANLPPDAREALAGALADLRRDGKETSRTAMAPEPWLLFHVPHLRYNRCSEVSGGAQ